MLKNLAAFAPTGNIYLNARSLWSFKTSSFDCETYLIDKYLDPIVTTRHCRYIPRLFYTMKYYHKDSKKPFRVSIEGNIGCGKSTLMQYLGRFPEVDTNPEPIAKWRDVRGHNLLDLLYKDLKRWNFTFSHFVQLTRLKAQTKACSREKVQIFERSLQNNRHVFVELAYRSDFLNDLEYKVLCDWFEWSEENMDIHLDLIVYLRSSPEVVMKRIKQRQRPEEASISLEYLQQVHEYHETWLANPEVTPPAPVLEINVDQDLPAVHLLYQRFHPFILGQQPYPHPQSCEA